MPPSDTKQFSGIFVSYRRDDSSGHAGRLFDKLVDHFGRDRIFMDIDTIEPGEDFVTVIENAVGSCEILIAVIGRNWLSGTVGATGRLDNPNDFVRVEIATALSRDIRVIPVLVQRATMPKPLDLPDNLAKLTRRNAVELSDIRWQSDVDQLVGVLERVLAKREAVRLAEAASQAEEERQRRAEEEKRRVEEEKQLRLAEEEATQRAAEERRREEDEIERREVKERARLEAREASRRRAEEERAQAVAEGRSRAEQDAERRRVEAEQKAERRGLETEGQARAEKERIRLAAEEAKRQRAAEQALHASREEKQTKPDLFALITPPTSGSEAQLSDSQRKRTMVLVITGCIGLLVLITLIWRQTREGEQQSTNQLTSIPQTSQQPVPPPEVRPSEVNSPSLNANIGGGDHHPVGVGGADHDKVFSSREVNSKARLTYKPEAGYTEEARKNQITGTVLLRAVFTSSGQVTQIVVVRGLPYGLTEKAIAAARAIRFEPATKDGHAVSMYIQVEYTFNLY